jgi:hypothetical protein
MVWGTKFKSASLDTRSGGLFMIDHLRLRRLVCAAWIAVFWLGSTLWAEPPAVIPPSTSSNARPALQVAERAESFSQRAAPLLGPARPNEHPMMPALRWAYSGLGNIEKIEDYSAILVKHERMYDGKLKDYEYAKIKVRHRPFSVYMCFIAPAEIKGREVIYIEGKNNGNIWAHDNGMRKKLFGTVSLKPDGPVAMKDQRYPITELGILNLTRRLVQVAEQDVKYGECEVKFYKNARVNNRVCTIIEAKHPIPRRNFLFHLARIYVDDELNLPIRYEAFDWPKEPNGPPELTEEYTYMNLKLNNGFTDADFDKNNPCYQFR